MPALTALVTSHVRIRRSLSITRGKDDFEFDDFVPLSVRALLFGNGKQRLQTLAWGDWLGFAHEPIIALIADIGINHEHFSCQTLALSQP